MKKYISICLSLILIFSTTGFSFAVEDIGDPPSKPQVSSYEDNNKIEEYNKQAEEYNKKVDEYNNQIDQEYSSEKEKVDKENQQRQSEYESSKKAHDEAVKLNEKLSLEAEQLNIEIDNKNAISEKEVAEYNLLEDQKVQQSIENRNRIEQINLDNKKLIDEYNSSEDQKKLDSEEEYNKIDQLNKDNREKVNKHNLYEENAEKLWNDKVDQEYKAALEAEQERIQALIKENEDISLHNQQEEQRIADAEKYNEEEQLRIENENKAKEDKYLEDYNQYLKDYKQYELDLEQYDKDYAQYKIDKELEDKILAAVDANGNPRYSSIEEYNNVVSAYNAKVELRNSQIDTINTSYGITDEQVLATPERNSSAASLSVSDTYEIIESNVKSGRKIPVHIEHNFYGTSVSYSEDFEIDANDTITLKGMAPAGDVLNETDCLFFYNTDANHSLGMWSNSMSTLYTNPTATTDSGWKNGDTHTITYKDSTNEYQWNFEDISISYNYFWIPLYKKSVPYDYANVPVKPTEPEEPIAPVMEDLETFVPTEYSPAEIWELKDISENEIIKGDYYVKDLWEYSDQDLPEIYSPEYKIFKEEQLPEVYDPVYKEYVPIDKVVPQLVEIPIIKEWEKLSDPVKQDYLSHVDLMDLFDVPEPVIGGEDPEDPDPEEPSEEEILNDIPAIVTTADNVTSINYGNNSSNNIRSYIKDANIPLSNIDKVQNYWALLNLILAILTCIISFLLILFGIWNNRHKYDEDKKLYNKWLSRIISVIVAISSVVLFFITENINNPWVWIDQWTIIMAIIFILQVIILCISKHRIEIEE